VDGGSQTKKRIEGTKMPYVVKWVAAGQRKVNETPTAYPTPGEAIDFACTILKQRPEKVWIEGPSGQRIEKGAIELNCEARGMR
jgi:hypothetical protein